MGKKKSKLDMSDEGVKARYKGLSAFMKSFGYDDPGEGSVTLKAGEVVTHDYESSLDLAYFQCAACQRKWRMTLADIRGRYTFACPICGTWGRIEVEKPEPVVSTAYWVSVHDGYPTEDNELPHERQKIRFDLGQNKIESLHPVEFKDLTITNTEGLHLALWDRPKDGRCLTVNRPEFDYPPARNGEVHLDNFKVETLTVPNLARWMFRKAAE